MGSYCLELTGNPQNTYQTGVSSTFSSSTPEYASFYIKTSNTARYRSGYVDIGNSSDLDGLLYFYQQYDDVRINGTYYYNITTSNQWHHFELRNIDFTGKTFDLYLDDSLLVAGQPFYNTSITSVDVINLHKYYNDVSSPDVFFDNVQIGFPPSDWMSVDVSTDTIPPGDSTVVNVTFTSCPVNVDSYSGSILLYSNDPLNSPDTVPVSFTVWGTGEIALSDSCLDFDTIIEISTAIDSFRVFNNGCDTLFLTDFNNLLTEYVVSDTTDTLLPGDSAMVYITFAPTSPGLYEDTLTILNNDTVIKVCLTGFAIPRPTIVLSQNSIHVSDSGCCDSTSVSIEVTNTGGSDLEWTFSLGLSLTDDFDPDIDGTIWSSLTGIASTTCGAMSGNALFFTNNGTREATTVDMNVLNGGSIQFYLKISELGGSCEDADSGEEVVLQ